MYSKPFSNRRILCSINDDFRDGHAADLRFSVSDALLNLPHSILQDIPKTPQHTLSKVLEQFLLARIVLIDGLSTNENSDAEKLIQFGICYALRKSCALLYVINNSQGLPTIKCPMLDSFRVNFNNYLDIPDSLPRLIMKWLEEDITWPNDRNPTPVRAFSAFGMDIINHPDLHNTVNEFAQSANWTARIYNLQDYATNHAELSRRIGTRSFCIFCLSEANDNSIYVGIGIAIGMGIPFLVLRNERATLPTVLSGYDGIIQYSSYKELTQRLRHYTSIFLCDAVQNWNGAPFFHLLAYLEERLSQAESETEFDALELILEAVLKAVGRPLAKPYVLLGDLYRQRNYHLAPANKALLERAISFYQKALKFQPDFVGCADKIRAVDRHIQLIELLVGDDKNKSRSIPALIQLIGSDISSEYYREVREYLLGVVQELINNEEYPYAISLLVAISRHDGSDRVKDLIRNLLDSVPEAYLEAIQDAQEYIAILENEKGSLTFSLTEKDELISNQHQEIGLVGKRLIETEIQLQDTKAKQDQLEKDFNGYLGQLKVLYEKIDLARDLGSRRRGVLVNFGFGWAIYTAFNGIPQVRRDEYLLPAKEGLVLIDNDLIFDDQGGSLKMLPPEYRKP